MTISVCILKKLNLYYIVQIKLVVVVLSSFQRSFYGLINKHVIKYTVNEIVCQSFLHYFISFFKIMIFD